MKSLPSIQSANRAAHAVVRRACACLLVLLVPVLGGCAAVSGAFSAVTGVFSSAPRPVSPDWKSLVFLADDQVNQNSPIAVDLVLAREQAVVDAVQALPASRWFASRTDIERSFPQGLSVTRMELVPGQSMRLSPETFAATKVLAAFVFADYPVAGEQRERLLLDARGYLIQLGARGFKATAAKTD
jgi:type VI secretion system protein